MRFLLALVLILGLTAAAEPKTSLPDIEDEVMCVECHTALNVSTAPVADQERAFIREKIAQGLTKKQIKAALVDAYGPDVLAEPEAKGFDLSRLDRARRARRRSRRSASASSRGAGAARRPAPKPPTAPDLDPDDARRLDDELATFDR